MENYNVNAETNLQIGIDAKKRRNIAYQRKLQLMFVFVWNFSLQFSSNLGWLCRKYKNNVLGKELMSFRSVRQFCKCGRCKTSDTVGQWKWKFERPSECFCCQECKSAKTAVAKRISSHIMPNTDTNPQNCITENEEFVTLCLNPIVSLCFSVYVLNVFLIQVLHQCAIQYDLQITRGKNQSDDDWKTCSNRSVGNQSINQWINQMNLQKST